MNNYWSQSTRVREAQALDTWDYFAKQLSWYDEFVLPYLPGKLHTVFQCYIGLDKALSIGMITKDDYDLVIKKMVELMEPLESVRY